MMGHTLPRILCVGGRDYPIRWQFGAVLDVLAAYNDPDLLPDEKTETMLTIIYPDFLLIPPEDLPEAIEKALDFIDCGQKESGRPKPKLIDWNQDAPIIFPAINVVANCDVRENPNIHWWTFYGYYMSIGDSLLSSVIRIRSKKAKGKKLEKYENEFYRENAFLIDLKKPESQEVRAEKDSILKWLN